MMNGRMDFTFTGGSLTRTGTSGYNHLSPHTRQERRIMETSSLTREYTSVLSGQGEYLAEAAPYFFCKKVLPILFFGILNPKLNSSLFCCSTFAMVAEHKFGQVGQEHKFGQVEANSCIRKPCWIRLKIPILYVLILTSGEPDGPRELFTQRMKETVSPWLLIHSYSEEHCLCIRRVCLAIRANG